MRGSPLLAGVIHDDADGLGADRQIHRAADAGRERRILGGPVGEIAGLRNLEGAEQADIEMAAADDQERIGVMDEAAAR